MHWITAPGTSIPEERRIVTRASRELRAQPGVRDFGSHIGQAFLGEEIAGVELRRELGQHRPEGRLRQDGRRASTTSSTAHPGLYRNVQTYLRERIDEVLAGGASRSWCASSATPRRAASTADRVSKSLSTIHGHDGLHTSLQAEVPQIDVRVKLGVARRYGVKPGDVRRAAATLVAGEEVGDMFQGGGATDVTCGASRRRATA